MININLPLILLLFLCSSSALHSQVAYDTTIVTSGNYEKLAFRIGNGATQLFELSKKDVEVTAGRIEKIEFDKDTIAVKHDVDVEEFEVQFSRKNWKKILFGRACVHLAAQIEEFPMLHFVTDKESKELKFKNPKQIGEFLKSNYQKRIDCIGALED